MEEVLNTFGKNIKTRLYPTKELMVQLICDFI